MISNYLLKFSFVMMAAMIIYLIIRMFILRKWEGRNEWPTIIFIGYMVGLASLTISPTTTIGLQESIARGNYNIIPFKTLWNQINFFSYGSFINLLGNVLLFIPIGFLAPVTWKYLSTIRNSFYLGFCISFSIEFIQLFIGRTSDVDDLLLNTLAVMVGAFIYRKIKKLE